MLHPEQRCAPTVVAQHLWEGLHVVVILETMVRQPGEAVGMWVPAGEQGAPGRRAQRRSGMGVGEADAVFGHRVHRRALDTFGPVAGEVATEVMPMDQQNVLRHIHPTMCVRVWIKSPILQATRRPGHTFDRRE